ncbi:MAG: cytochrome c3 family protein [Deltaproteobacteria bacterium]|nr:cytochrome c3 family protein [Deltaproteobacteria bacterium]
MKAIADSGRERKMKYMVFMWIGLLMIVATAFPAYSQDDVIVINSKALGNHTRPLVRFPHLKHEDQIDCSECHHEYDKSGENIGGDGEDCSDCHTKNAGSNPIPLMEAFHLECKRCHAKEISSSQNKNMPQMCGQCHVRRKRDKR